MKKFAQTGMLFVGTLLAVASIAWASGWESATCTGTETWNGEICALLWCVNQDMAYYNCEGIATAKYSCSGGCGDIET